MMKNKGMAFVINTPSGKNPREDEVKIRTAAMQNRIPNHDHTASCRGRTAGDQFTARQ
jgi:hypothetical protein